MCDLTLLIHYTCRVVSLITKLNHEHLSTLIIEITDIFSINVEPIKLVKPIQYTIKLTIKIYTK